MALASPAIFFNVTATTEIYTLSLHDALPICGGIALAAERPSGAMQPFAASAQIVSHPHAGGQLRDIDSVDLWGPDRKSTRLNSSHSQISYAVFCLKKKKHAIQPLLIPLHSYT